MELGNIALYTSDNSRAYLNINSKIFDYKSSGKSKARLNLKTDSSYVELSDTSKLDALIKSRVANFDLFQRSDATIEGISDASLIRVDNLSNLTGSEFQVKQVEAILEDNSNMTIAAEESISISASGNSELYLYNNPSIIINKFEGNSKMQKKERQ